MIGLWRVAVAVALGALVGVTGYDVWQTRDVNDAWGFALLGALTGLAIGMCTLQVGQKHSSLNASGSTRASHGQERVCYGTLAEPHEEAAGIYTEGAWKCPMCGRQV